MLFGTGGEDGQTLAGIGLSVRVGTALSFGDQYTHTDSAGTSRTESVRVILRALF